MAGRRGNCRSVGRPGPCRHSDDFVGPSRYPCDHDHRGGGAGVTSINGQQINSPVLWVRAPSHAAVSIRGVTIRGGGNTLIDALASSVPYKLVSRFEIEEE